MCNRICSSQSISLLERFMYSRLAISGIRKGCVFARQQSVLLESVWLPILVCEWYWSVHANMRNKRFICVRRTNCHMFFWSGRYSIRSCNAAICQPDLAYTRPEASMQQHICNPRKLVKETMLARQCTCVMPHACTVIDFDDRRRGGKSHPKVHSQRCTAE